MNRSPDIAIIGAGFGGLAVALELKHAGIDSFTVLERAEDVGGVWQANTYPGAACDVPSVIYQFSRHLKPDWSRRFGSQPEIRDVSFESGVRDQIRYGGAVEVRRDVHNSFNAELQARLPGTVFTTGCPGWYTTADGKVTTVWAGSHVEYRRRTRRFDPSAYHVLAPAPVAASV